MRKEAYYDIALVCLNGHLITSMLESMPEKSCTHCPDCGEKTIFRCPSCETHIRGYHHMPGVVSMSPDEPPAYCHNCGQPYPWTEARLKAAKELIDLEERLSNEEKETLQKSLVEIMTDNPRTVVAATRLKLFIAKTAKTVGPALRDIVINIGCDLATKTFLGV